MHNPCLIAVRWSASPRVRRALPVVRAVSGLVSVRLRVALFHVDARMVPKRAAAVVSFLGHEVSPEAQFALRQLPKLDSLDDLLVALSQQIAGTPPTPESFRHLQRSMSLDSQTAGGLYSGVHWLLRTAMRSTLQQKALTVELEDLKIPQPFVEPLVRTVIQGRAALGDQGLGGLPSLEELRWRLDVSISTSGLHRVLRPHLTLQCELGDGTTHAFYASKQRFEELRYTCARLLNDMQAVGARLPALAHTEDARRRSTAPPVGKAPAANLD